MSPTAIGGSRGVERDGGPFAHLAITARVGRRRRVDHEVE